MITVAHVVLVGMVLAGALALAVGCFQFGLSGIHALRRPYARATELYPRVAVVIPAWNEGAVIGRTIDQLLAMDYPFDRLRIYVVDDGSTDETPHAVAERVSRCPDVVVYLRRESGGSGKADAINFGIRRIQRDDWYEALLIIDADVLVSSSALRRMTRHFGDAQVGGVTAYIKEGSRPPNYINRFVAFEYITAQAVARRAQNALDAHACLAGGAQLIKRTALEHLGGQLDTGTLAEDTVTTFRIQLAGYRVRFDGNAIVWAEEPNTLAALWRQRVRWARGNVQVTRRYGRVWRHPVHVGALGGPTFAAIWTSVTLMPVFMLSSTIGLVTLFFTDRELSIRAFEALWALTGATYVVVTLSSLLIDPESARRCWLEALLFPGLVNLVLIVFGLFGPALTHLLAPQLTALGLGPGTRGASYVLFFADLWLSLSVAFAYTVKRLEDSRWLRWLAPPLLYLVGFGPLLCAMTVGGYVAEARGADRRWEKTDKVGRIGEVMT